MKLEMNYEKKTGKNTNMWRLSRVSLNNQWVNKKPKKEFKNAYALRKMKIERQLSKIYWTHQK